MGILIFFDGMPNLLYQHNGKFVMMVVGVVLAYGYALCDLTSFKRRALRVFFVLLEGFFVLLTFGTVVARAMAIL